MKQIDLSNTIAAEMDRALNSDENKQIFSNSSMLEKLAFKKVSEQDQVSEVEMELDPSLRKIAGCCECGEDKKHECHCDCHKDTEKKEEKKAAPRNQVRDAFFTLLRVSDVLDAAGFEKLAATTILVADKLIVEAKEKSSKKSDKKSEKAKSDAKSKAKTKTKMDMKERMKKMREGQKGKGKKDDKKSSKK